MFKIKKKFSLSKRHTLINYSLVADSFTNELFIFDSIQLFGNHYGTICCFDCELQLSDHNSNVGVFISKIQIETKKNK